MDTLFKTKLFYLITVVVITLGSFSCTGKTVKQQYSYIGLYEIKTRQCHVPDISLDDCKKTKFIELVKGQFFGIKNNEVAVVMWRGDSGGELLYQARKIEQTSAAHLNDVITISNTGTVAESLKLVDGVVSEYSLVISKTANSSTTTNNITYTLKPVKRGLLPEYRMNYPGND